MGFLQALFKPSKTSFMKQYISVLAHLTPYGKIEKDFDNLTVTLITNNGQSVVDLTPLYKEWLDCHSDKKESYLLAKTTDQITEANDM